MRQDLGMQPDTCCPPTCTDCLPAEPSPSGQDEAPGAFPFLAGGGSPVQMADAGMQTGTSLAAEDEEQAAAAADAAAAGALHEDAYGDAGGGFEDAGAYEQPGVDAGGSQSLRCSVAATDPGGSIPWIRNRASV